MEAPPRQSGLAGVSPATMPDGVSPAAEAISASEDALMPDSEAAAIMSSLSSGAGSNDCLLIMPVPAADSSAAPVVGTIAVAGCPNCHGNHRWAHTCGKRRNGSSIVAVSRSLRPKRGESSEPASLLSRGSLRSGGRYASSRKCSSQYRITLYSMSADGLTTNGNAVFCAYFSHISARDNLWGATSPLDPTPRAFGVYTTVLEAQLY